MDWNGGLDHPSDRMSVGERFHIDKLPFQETRFLRTAPGPGSSHPSWDATSTPPRGPSLYPAKGSTVDGPGAGHCGGGRCVTFLPARVSGIRWPMDGGGPRSSACGKCRVRGGASSGRSSVSLERAQETRPSFSRTYMERRNVTSRRRLGVTTLIR